MSDVCPICTKTIDQHDTITFSQKTRQVYHRSCWVKAVPVTKELDLASTPNGTKEADKTNEQLS